MRVFFDSSAFVKRYIQEAGTEEIVAWCDRATEIVLAGIALPEIISAFCRLRRESRIDNTQYRQLKTLLLADIEDAAICDLTPLVIARTIAALKPCPCAAWMRSTSAAHSSCKPTYSSPPTSVRLKPHCARACGSMRYEVPSNHMDHAFLLVPSAVSAVDVPTFRRVRLKTSFAASGGEGWLRRKPCQGKLTQSLRSHDPHAAFLHALPQQCAPQPRHFRRDSPASSAGEW